MLFLLSEAPVEVEQVMPYETINVGGKSVKVWTNMKSKIVTNPVRAERGKGEKSRRKAGLLQQMRTNKLVAQFDDLWIRLGGPELVREYRFHPKRKWRFDRAFLDKKVGIEIDGGVWSGGRHVRGRGFEDDAMKINAATALGWRVFRLTTTTVHTTNVEQIIEACKN